MSASYSFYLVVDHVIEGSANIVHSLASLSTADTAVHFEHINGLSTFQISTSDFLVAVKIRLQFSAFIIYEDLRHAQLDTQVEGP